MEYRRKKNFGAKSLNVVLIEPNKDVFNKIQLVIEKNNRCSIEINYKVDNDDFDVNEKVYKVFIKHGKNYYDAEYDILNISRNNDIVTIKCTLTKMESHFITIVKRNALTYGVSKVFGRVAIGNVTYTKK